MRFLLSDPSTGVGALQQDLGGEPLGQGSLGTPTVLLDGIQGTFDIYPSVTAGLEESWSRAYNVPSGVAAATQRLIRQDSAGSDPAGWYRIMALELDRTLGASTALFQFYLYPPGDIATVTRARVDTWVVGASQQANLGMPRPAASPTSASAVAVASAFPVLLPPGWSLQVDFPTTAAGEEFDFRLLGTYRPSSFGPPAY